MPCLMEAPKQNGFTRIKSLFGSPGSLSPVSKKILHQGRMVKMAKKIIDNQKTTKTKVGYHLPSDIVTAVRVNAAKEGRRDSHIVEDALRKYFNIQ